MKVDSNPFFSRASQFIEQDDKFIKLFSPEILTLLKTEESNVWGPVKILRSSPGGGKTTLLKIFTARILINIQQQSTHDAQKKAILDVLTELGVFDHSGKVLVAGSLLSFSNEYISLEYLKLDDGQKLRLFFSLLNTRIVLSILQSVCITKDIKFPEDLNQVNIAVDKSAPIPASIRSLTNGQQFYDWACKLEQRICQEIDSIHEINTTFLEGSEGLFALDVLAPANITINNIRAVERILVMLDDVHNLTKTQRKHLITGIVDKRHLVHTWVSERLKALTVDEIFSEGSKVGRDIIPIQLESFWSKKHTAFEKFAKSVASRRVVTVFDDRDDFSVFLSENLDNQTLRKIREALAVVKKKINDTYGNNQRYKEWINTKENLEIDNELDQLIEWRSLEILLYRDKNKGIGGQTTLALDEVLDDDDLQDQDGSDVKDAAHLFLNKELGIPYYYGIKKIARLASFNIEQFLFIAGYLFEDILTIAIKRIANPGIKLEISPLRQEEIIKKNVSPKKYTDVINLAEVKNFLDSIGQFCQSETYLPNAWNSPGINGIAITMKERALLKDKVLNDPQHMYYNLTKCLATCFSNNLLEFKLDYKCKGNVWMVIYINKLYCINYNLPLGNGKFRERNLKILLHWFNYGFKQTQTPTV
ncbi:MAG: hypothetical protein HYZ44_18310 [Bacteroidetes bacterium]|nr:hypothetical protein [Bacteroidota bacterium]